MPRYILIDRYSGYIFADTADLPGFDKSGGTPIEAAQLLDREMKQDTREYGETNRADDERDYDVYRADIDGSEILPIVWDGQDQAIIELVKNECAYVTSLVGHDND